MKNDYPGTATLIVVSDHGFSPIEHQILPNVVLRNLGLVTVDNGKAAGGSVHVVVQGGSALLYLLDSANRTAMTEKIRKAFEAVPGVSKIVGPGQLKEHGVAEPTEDPHAPDMILFAAEGYSFSYNAGGNAAVIDESPQKGTHGHDEHLPNLHASFIAWGTGIKPGARGELINNTDVAPTIARLLGLEFGHSTGKAVDVILAQ